MTAQIRGPHGHTVPSNVVRTGRSYVDISPAAHIDQIGQRGNPRERGHFTEPFLYVSLFQAGQDLNRNARMLDLKALEQRREMPRRKTRRRRKTDLAFERAVVILQSVHQRVVRPQNRLHAFVRHAACVREDQWAHAVADKLNAEGALEPRNGAGNTRGFCFERFCRCRQRAASGKNNERAPSLQIICFCH